MDVLHSTQHQWFTRPEDEKFASLEDVLRVTAARKAGSKWMEAMPKNLNFIAIGDDLKLIHTKGDRTDSFDPSNWAFAQVCAKVGAHATYLEDLPADLAAKCLNHGLGKLATEKPKTGFELLYTSNGKAELRAATGAYYGRIWHHQTALVAQELVDLSGGKYEAPLDWGKVKRSLFESDRDIHLLFVNGGSIVDGGPDQRTGGDGDQLYRGFMLRNSEVGNGAYYFATFLFRWICGNFGIHGIEGVETFKIAHTMNAPTKFAAEMMPRLKAYFEASARPLEQVVRKAKDHVLPKDEDHFSTYFRNRGFAKHETATARTLADKEELGHGTLWHMYNGFTRAANDLKFVEARVNLQKRAGKLLEQLA